MPDASTLSPLLMLASGLAFGLGLLALAITAAMVAAGRRSRARAAGSLQRLARREHEMRTLVGAVHQLVFRTDVEGRIDFVNRRWEAVSGLEPRDARGRSFASLVPEDERERVAALFSTAHGPQPRQGRVTLTHPTRGARRFELMVVPLTAPAGHSPGTGLPGRIEAFAGAAIDITERTQAEARLQAHVRFSDLLLQVTPLPESLLSREGRLLEVNPAWEAFHQRPRRTVIGRLANEVLGPDAIECLPALPAASCLPAGPVPWVERQVRAGDGTRRDVQVMRIGVPPRDDGDPAAMLVVMMDITEFRDAERLTTRAREQAEEASRAKSEFVANISHELRTPLQSILGFSELGMARDLPRAQSASVFGDIHDAGRRMLALVDDLLDVARLESQVGTLHLERTDLRETVRVLADELSPLLADRRLRLDLAFQDGARSAKTDPLRLQQVLRNVLANAIRFSPRGQVVELEAAPLDDGGVALSVLDRGPGVPDDEIERIFEPFVQSSRTKDGSGGTGLGLAICRKIMDALGGSIHAENRPGGGARFELRLPPRGFADSAFGPGA